MDAQRHATIALPKHAVNPHLPFLKKEPPEQILQLLRASRQERLVKTGFDQIGQIQKRN
ncbi:MAG: hypothetical protein JMDDDDMK_02137 [Acidobacteria bacterium]|nr:hypothetical protein [Acidobacteriota bacterium]